VTDRIPSAAKIEYLVQGYMTEVRFGEWVNVDRLSLLVDVVWGLEHNPPTLIEDWEWDAPVRDIIVAFLAELWVDGRAEHRFTDESGNVLADDPGDIVVWDEWRIFGPTASCASSTTTWSTNERRSATA